MEPQEILAGLVSAWPYQQSVHDSLHDLAIEVSRVIPTILAVGDFKEKLDGPVLSEGRLLDPVGLERHPDARVVGKQQVR